MDSPRNILLFSTDNKAAFQELLAVATQLKTKTTLNPVIVTPDETSWDSGEFEKTSLDIHSAITRYGLKVVNIVNHAVQRLIPSRFHQWDLYVFFEMGITWLTFHFQLISIRQLFKKYNPPLILSTATRALYRLAMVQKVAHTRNCPTIMIPFAQTLKDGPALGRLRDPRRQLSSPILKKWKQRVAHKYPGQVYESQYGTFIYGPPVLTLVSAWMDLLPEDPWRVGDTFDVIMAFGRAEYDQYVEWGTPAGKIELLGQVSLDKMYEIWENKDELTQSLRQKYFLEPDLPIIICAVPHLGEHRILPWDEHWKTTRFLAKSLTEQDANVLFSLHPKSRLEDYAFLEESDNAHILDEPLNSVLPAADLLVATYSSTVRWAVMLEIPVIIIDLGWFNYHLFDGYRGILKVNHEESLPSTIQNLLEDKAYYHKLKSAQAESADYIGMFDGRAAERLIALIRSLYPDA